MSYTTAMSSYYTFSPHEIMSGFGFNPQPEPPRYGSVTRGRTFSPGAIRTQRMRFGMQGFGSAADTFDPDQVMAYIATSDQCYGPGGKGAADPRAGACNFAGQKANREIQVALNQLGYGPLNVDGTLNWQGAYAQFLADHGLTKGPGFGITKQALVVMKDKMMAGETPGGGAPVEYERVGGELVPTGKTKLSKQSKIALGLVAAGVVGAIAIVAMKKRKKGQPPPKKTA